MRVSTSAARSSTDFVGAERGELDALEHEIALPEGRVQLEQLGATDADDEHRQVGEPGREVVEQVHGLRRRAFDVVDDERERRARGVGGEEALHRDERARLELSGRLRERLHDWAIREGQPEELREQVLDLDRARRADGFLDAACDLGARDLVVLALGDAEAGGRAYAAKADANGGAPVPPAWLRNTTAFGVRAEMRRASSVASRLLPIPAAPSTTTKPSSARGALATLDEPRQERAAADEARLGARCGHGRALR